MSRRACFRFRLYVAGATPNSAQARANLAAFCGDHLAGRHEIEIVDVFKEPKRALADGILMTPMLLKIAPSPPAKIVGTLSERKTVMQVLGLGVDIA